MTERPYLGPDQTYDKQRRCRLADVIGDYLQDEDCDARRFYEEMLSELNDWIDYHRRFARKGENMRELMMSGTALSFDQSVKDYSDILTGLDNC
jgi:hypothetical protein